MPSTSPSPHRVAPLSPLPALALAWTVGVTLGPHVGLPGSRALGFALALASGLVVWRAGKARSRIWGWLLAAPTLVVGLCLPRTDRVELPRALVEMEAKVARADAATAVRPASVEVVTIRGRSLEGPARVAAGVRVRVPDLDAPPGTRLRMRCSLAPSPRYDNPSPHPELFPRDVVAWCRLQHDPTILERASTPRGWIHGARRTLAQALSRSLSPEAAGVARALLLGESRAVDMRARSALRASGMSHLLAISGLHVGIAFAIFAALFRRLLRPMAEPTRWAALASMPPLLLFAVMAGLGPSVQRATTMAALATVALVARRRPSALAILSLTVLLVGFGSPAEARSPGLLLSVLATAALVTTPRDPSRAPLRDALLLSLRATLATTPIALVGFGSAAPLGVLANALIAPVAAALLIPLVMLHGLAALTFPESLAPLTGGSFELGVRLLVDGAELVASVPTPALPPLTRVQGVLLGLGAAMLLWGPRRLRGVALVAMLGGLWLEEVRVRQVEAPVNELRATFLDVDQGDATLLDLPDGTLTIVDTGPAAAAERALLPVLRARRRRVIDRVILTHAHPDHFGGLAALAAEFPIREVWDSGQAEFETPRGGLARVLGMLRARGTRIVHPREVCARPTRHGAATLRILWPCPGFDAGLGPNDNSLVVRVDLAPSRHQRSERRMLFTGDAERIAERSLLALGADLRADLLQVGHHGSRTSSSEAILRAISPAHAVISCGVASRYGHPHDEVLDRFRRRRIDVHATPRAGGLMVRWGLE